MYSSKQLSDEFNDFLKQQEIVHYPENLYEPIKYVLSLGGKRIRPTLMLLAYNLYKENPSEILNTATAIEVYHNYTLLHDDLMDKADKRRGALTVHKKWNDNTAILSGDAMLVLAYQYLAKTNSANLKTLIDLFSQTAMEICEGQQLDMEFEHRFDVSEKEYIEMIRLKTAVLLAASLKIGSILGGASKEDADNLYNFGIQIGLAFQLQDDWLDVYGDASVFGKNIGGDILCDKKTFLLIKTFEQADRQQLSTLNKWIGKETHEPELKILTITDIYNQLGIGDICMQKIKEYYSAGMTYLNKVSVESSKKEALIELVHQMIKRNI